MALFINVGKRSFQLGTDDNGKIKVLPPGGKLDLSDKEAASLAAYSKEVVEVSKLVETPSMTAVKAENAKLKAENAKLQEELASLQSVSSEPELVEAGSSKSKKAK